MRSAQGRYGLPGTFLIDSQSAGVGGMVARGGGSRVMRSAQGRYGLPGTFLIDSQEANQLTNVPDLDLGVLSSAVAPERKPGVGLPW